MIEVLVAVLILSIGLLGMAALQARALKGNHSSLQRTQAVMLSYYILDAMRADRETATSGTFPYNMSKTCAVPVDMSSRIVNAKREWLQALKDNIGNVDTTCGTVTCDINGICKIEVHWDDSRAAGGTAEKLETVGRL